MEPSQASPVRPAASWSHRLQPTTPPRGPRGTLLESAAWRRINDHYLKLKSSYLFPEIARRVRAFQEANPDAQDHPPRHRRRHRSRCRPRDRARCTRRSTRWRSRETLPRLRPRAGLRLPARRDRQARLRRARRRRRRRRDLRLRRLQVRQRQHPGDLRRRHRRRGHRSGLPGLRRHQRDGRPHRRRRRRAAATRASSICRARPRTASSRRCPTGRVDLIYLCFPNNPTGAVLTKAAAEAVGRLRAARTTPSSSSTPPTRPTSASPTSRTRSTRSRARARSPSSSAASPRPPASPAPAAPTRSCPRTLDGPHRGRRARCRCNALWNRRHTTKFNGVPYSIQKAAAAIYTDEGKREVRALIDFYMENARIIRAGWRATGLTVYGGATRPTSGSRRRRGQSSWDFFDKLLSEAHVVGTPGLRLRPERRGLLPARPPSGHARRPRKRSRASRRGSRARRRPRGRGPRGVRRPRGRGGGRVAASIRWVTPVQVGSETGRRTPQGPPPGRPPPWPVSRIRMRARPSSLRRGAVSPAAPVLSPRFRIRANQPIRPVSSTAARHQRNVRLTSAHQRNRGGSSGFSASARPRSSAGFAGAILPLT